MQKNGSLRTEAEVAVILRVAFDWRREIEREMTKVWLEFFWDRLDFVERPVDVSSWSQRSVQRVIVQRIMFFVKD